MNEEMKYQTEQATYVFSRPLSHRPSEHLPITHRSLAVILVLNFGGLVAMSAT